MKKRTLAMRFMSMALAAVMAVGMSATAFAADGDSYKGDQGNIDHIEGGATGATGGGAYPAGLTQDKMGTVSSVDQYIDKSWTLKTDGINGDSKDETTITVTGITDKGRKDTEVTVMAYQIVKPVYFTVDGETGVGYRFKGWEQAGAFDGVKLVGDDMCTINENFTRDNLAAVAKNIAGLPSVKMDPANDGNGTYTATVKPGAWLILVSGAEAATYGPMVVSSYYTKDGMAEGKLGLVQNRAFAKRQDAPTIEKNITGMWGNNGGGWDVLNDIAGTNQKTVNNGVATVGDYVWFDILVKNLPEYHGDHALFKVTDEIDDNLKIDRNSIMYTFLYSGASGEYPKYSVDDPIGDGNTYPFADPYTSVDLTGKVSFGKTDKDNALVLDFCTGTRYNLNDYAGFDMVIRYKAEVVSDGEFDFNGGVAEMPNKAYLDYTHNSTVEGEDDREETDEPIVYTFRLDMSKVDGIDMTTGLDGAIFELRVAGDDDTWENADGFYGSAIKQTVGEGDKAVTETTDSLLLASKTVGEDKGVLIAEGLSDGVYLLKEKYPNDGYSANDTVYKIEIVADKDEAGCTVTGMTLNLNGEAVAIDSIKIPNVKMNDLPTTGGAGTALLIGVGLIGALIGCVVIFGTRKKQED